MSTKDQIFFILLAGMVTAFLFRFSTCAENIEIERNRYYEKIRLEKSEPTPQASEGQLDE